MKSLEEIAFYTVSVNWVKYVINNHQIVRDDYDTSHNNIRVQTLKILP